MSTVNISASSLSSSGLGSMGIDPSSTHPRSSSSHPSTSFVSLNCASSTSQPLPSMDSSPLHFTSSNKMSLFSLEKRIDYHLSRIMKGHRLINFKNSIERLPTEKRICECIIEVLMSSMNLIARKTKIIADSQTLANQLRSVAEQNVLCKSSTSSSTNESSANICPDSPTTTPTSSATAATASATSVPIANNSGIPASFATDEYVIQLNEIKSMAIGLEQIIWALNSNKEHIKYIVKVFTVPEKYQRSEFNTDPASIVPLRQSIVQTIDQCEQVILICRALRNKLSDSLIKAFISHF